MRSSVFLGIGWPIGLCGRAEGVAIDGQALRGIHGEEIPGVYLVAAYHPYERARLAQSATIGKGQETQDGEALLGTGVRGARDHRGRALRSTRVLPTGSR